MRRENGLLFEETSCLEAGFANDIWIGTSGGAGGRRVMEPTGFLRDYWMGRYHGIIEAPSTDKKDLLSITMESKGNQGAKPCDGPGRPGLY